MTNDTSNGPGKGGNPRELGVLPLGKDLFALSEETADGAKVTRIHGVPEMTDQKWEDQRIAAAAARNKILQERNMDPEYLKQFMPPEDSGVSAPEPVSTEPVTPPAVIDGLPEGFTTPPAGNLRAVGDMIEVPDAMKAPPAPTEITPAPELIKGVPPELQAPPTVPPNPTPGQ